MNVPGAETPGGGLAAGLPISPKAGLPGVPHLGSKAQPTGAAQRGQDPAHRELGCSWAAQNSREGRGRAGRASRLVVRGSQPGGWWLVQGWGEPVAGEPDMTSPDLAESLIQDWSGPNGAMPGRSNL